MIPPPPRVYNNMLAAIVMSARVNSMFVSVVGKLQKSQITWFHTFKCAGGKMPLGVLHLMPNNHRPVLAPVSIPEYIATLLTWGLNRTLGGL